MSSFDKKTGHRIKKNGHWVICDRSGFAIRESDSRKTWDGLVVAKEYWEPRHPQDFVRARADDQMPHGNIRSDQEGTEIVAGDYVYPDYWKPAYTGNN